jgi:hypothetical protein
MTKERSRWIALVFISAAISLVIIDGTIVNTIFPAVIEALKGQSLFGHITLTRSERSAIAAMVTDLLDG